MKTFKHFELAQLIGKELRCTFHRKGDNPDNSRIVLRLATCRPVCSNCLSGGSHIVSIPSTQSLLDIVREAKDERGIAIAVETLNVYIMSDCIWDRNSGRSYWLEIRDGGISENFFPRE